HARATQLDIYNTRLTSAARSFPVFDIQPAHCSVPICFSHTPSPPQHTLFPYTTLFRSPSLSRRPPHSGRRTRASRAPGPAPGSPDRKSTRLNSSHRTISYAVFCLKKKKCWFVLLSHFCLLRGCIRVRGDLRGCATFTSG